MWKTYYSQLLNVHRVSDVRQIETHTNESFLPDSCSFKADIAIAKFKNYKLPVSGLILTEMIQAGGKKLQSENRKLINSTWSKKELPDQ
jgi:hypothetical protein